MRAAVVVALSAGLGLLVACGGGGGQPTATPAGSPAATVGPTTRLATATPGAGEPGEVIHGVKVVPLQVGDEVELPKDVALIVETGCWGCDGPTTALVRVYRDTSGEVRRDTLFTANATGLPPRGVTSSEGGTWTEEPYIHSFALNGDASEIVVSVCSRGDCAWLGPASADAQTTLFRSLDGGITWAQFGSLDGSSYIVAILKDGLVLRRPGEQAEPPYRLFPSGEPVEPPPQAGESWPLSLPSGELIWPTDDGRLLRSDGSEFLALGEGARLIFVKASIRSDPSGDRLAIVWWREALAEGSGQAYLGIAAPDGHLTEVFSLGDFATIGGWVDPKLLAGNVTLSAGELTATVPGPFRPRCRTHTPDPIPVPRSALSERS